MEHFLSIAVLVTSFTLTMLGFPLQIFQNFKRKSTEGLSWALTFFMFANNFMWLWYGHVKIPRDWILIYANIPGAVFTLVLLSQFLIYRKKF